MAQLNWQPASQRGSPGSSPQTISSTDNQWFAVSIGLMGLIVGFGVGKWRTGTFPVVAGAPPAQIIQAPTPQAPLPPLGGGCGTP